MAKTKKKGTRWHIYSGHGMKAAARLTAKRELAPRGFRYQVRPGSKKEKLRGSNWVVWTPVGGPSRRRLPRRRR